MDMVYKVEGYEYKGKLYKTREEALNKKYYDIIANRFTRICYDRGFKAPHVNLTVTRVLDESDWVIDTLMDYRREKHGGASLGTLPSEPYHK